METPGKETNGMSLKIWTSFFGNYNITKDPRAVSIARWCPFKGVRRYDKFIPSKELLTFIKTHYVPISDGPKLFRKHMLDKLDPLDVVRDLKRMSVNNEVILLCWCHDRNACHRKIVANWLKRAFKDDDVSLFEIKELPVHPKTKHRL